MLGNNRLRAAFPTVPDRMAFYQAVMDSREGVLVHVNPSADDDDDASFVRTGSKQLLVSNGKPGRRRSGPRK